MLYLSHIDTYSKIVQAGSRLQIEVERPLDSRVDSLRHKALIAALFVDFGVVHVVVDHKEISCLISDLTSSSGSYYDVAVCHSPYQQL